MNKFTEKKSQKPFPGKTEQSILLYDGDCPVCKTYIRLFRFRSQINSLKLLNAREEHEMVQNLQNAGININDGIVFMHKGRTYFGKDAMHVLSLMTSKRKWQNKINSYLFGNPNRARIVYPVFVKGRKTLLWLLRRSQI